ncbi:MAG: VCBS repeat-containing protein, partial [Myxococcota bacterium]|nr:VCBS repeat-containing protein [Myxococcota bacterium]
TFVAAGGSEPPVEEPPVEEPPVEEPPVEEPPVEEPPVEEPPVEEPPVEEPPVEEPPVEEPPVEEPPVELPPGDATVSTDFDGDGTPDILIRSSNTLQIWTVVDGRRSRILPSVSLPYSERVVGNGDYDGDGYADLLTHDESARALIVRLLVDGQTVDSSSFDLGSGWDVVASADFDGNGYTDIAVQHAGSDITELWSMDGTRIHDVVELPVLYSTGTVVGSGDFDGDGRADLLWRTGSSSSGSFWVWTIDESGTIDDRYVGGASRLDVRGICDTDGDGREDIILRHSTTGVMSTIRFPSGNPSSGSLSLVLKAQARSVDVASVGDLDADGDCDIVLTTLNNRPTLTSYLLEMTFKRSTWSLGSTSGSVVGVGQESPD